LTDTFIYPKPQKLNKKKDSEDIEDVEEEVLLQKVDLLNNITAENKINLISSSTQNILRKMKKSTRHYGNTSENKDLMMYDGSYSDDEKESSHEFYDLETQIDLNETIRLKYYLQWFLVIIVHFIVFWYFPSKSNMLAQNHYYCDPLSDIKIK
jgi:hypothetical protein